VPVPLDAITPKIPIGANGKAAIGSVPTQLQAFKNLVPQPFLDLIDNFKDKGPADPNIWDALDSKANKVPYKPNYADLSLYKTSPYGFKYSIGENFYEFWLPINPSNLTITTRFPNTITPTLYGVSIERSEVKIYNINISGTTGIAPRNTVINNGKPAVVAKDYEKGGMVDSNGRKTAQVSALTDVTKGLQELDPTGLVKNAVAPIADGIKNLTNSVFGEAAKSGFKNEQSGYVAFHNLYLYLWTYQKYAASRVDSKIAGDLQKSELIFLNYKDNNRYNVAPQSFSLIRSAESPYLYNYSIELTGYFLGGLDKTSLFSGFEGQDFYNNQLKALGLDGTSSTTIKAQANNVAGSIKNLTGSLRKIGLG
jgi:hypothetical protein